MHCIGASVRRRKPVQVASFLDSTYFGFVYLIIHANYLPETSLTYPRLFIPITVLFVTSGNVAWSHSRSNTVHRKLNDLIWDPLNSSFTRVNTNDPIFWHVFFDYLTSGKTVARWLTCKNHEHEPREIQTISLESNFRDFWNSSSALVPLRLLS